MQSGHRICINISLIKLRCTHENIKFIQCQIYNIIALLYTKCDGIIRSKFTLNQSAKSLRYFLKFELLALYLLVKNRKRILFSHLPKSKEVELFCSWL